MVLVAVYKHKVRMLYYSLWLYFFRTNSGHNPSVLGCQLQIDYAEFLFWKVKYHLWFIDYSHMLQLSGVIILQGGEMLNIHLSILLFKIMPSTLVFFMTV